MKKRKSVTVHEIHNFIYDHGPVTRNELVAGIPHACVQTVCFRLGEAQVAEVGRKRCRLTGKWNKVYALRPGMKGAMTRARRAV